MSLGVFSITQNPGCLTAAVSTIQESDKLISKKGVLKVNVHIHLASCQFQFPPMFQFDSLQRHSKSQVKNTEKIFTLFKNESHLA